MKIIGVLFLYFSTALSLFANEPIFISKTKSYKFEYSVSENDKLNVKNKYGNIKVIFWNKNMVSAQVTVSASAPSQDLLNKYLDQISIESSKVGSEINIFSIINLRSHSAQNNNTKLESNFKINYTIYIPDYLPINISNSFGEVELPDFMAPISLNLNHSDLKGKIIANNLSSINANFGSIDLKAMKGGRLNSNFTDVKISELKNITLNNNHGNLKVDNVSELNGILNYSKGYLGGIGEMIKLKMNYTDDFEIKNIKESIKNLEIQSNFSDLKLPVGHGFNGNFDIKTTHGSLSIRPDLPVRFSRNTSDEKRNTSNSIKTYQGKLGTSNTSKSKIIVISNYGDIKIK
jgi:hypothetical protein